MTGAGTLHPHSEILLRLPRSLALCSAARVLRIPGTLARAEAPSHRSPVSSTARACCAHRCRWRQVVAVVAHGTAGHVQHQQRDRQTGADIVEAVESVSDEHGPHLRAAVRCDCNTVAGGVQGQHPPLHGKHCGHLQLADCRASTVGARSANIVMKPAGGGSTIGCGLPPCDGVRGPRG